MDSGRLPRSRGSAPPATILATVSVAADKERVIPLDGLTGSSRRFGRAAIRSSDRSSATGRSSTTSWAPPTSSPQAGRRSTIPALPRRAARRRGALRFHGRAALVEAVPAPAACPALARSAERRGHGDRGGAAAGQAVRVLRSPQLRPGRDRDPGSRADRRPVRRPRLCGAPRGDLRHRRRLRRARPALLLRLDGHRPVGRERVRPRVDRAARRRAPVPRSDRQRARRRGDARGHARRRGCRRPGRRAYARRERTGEHGPDARHRRLEGGHPRRTSSIRAGTRSPTAASPAATARSSARPASASASRTPPTWPERRSSASASGTAASRSTTRTCTAGASVRAAARATGSG